MRNKKQFVLLLVAAFVFATVVYYSHALLDQVGYAQPGVTNFVTINHPTSFRDQNRAVFQKMGLTYLKNIEFDLSVIPKYLEVKHSERYLANPAYYDGLEKKYGKLISQGYVVPMSIRFINSKIGYGTFAESHIAKDQMVGEYTGIVMATKEIKDTKYTWDYLAGYDEQGKEFKFSVDAAKFGNEMRFVNHDYQPNAVMKYIPQGGVWHVVYIASRPIKKGEQILTDYGKRYWAGSRGAPHQFVNIDGIQNSLS